MLNISVWSALRVQRCSLVVNGVGARQMTAVQRDKNMSSLKHLLKWLVNKTNRWSFISSGSDVCFLEEEVFIDCFKLSVVSSA